MPVLGQRLPARVLGINHDAAIVFPENASPVVLVVMVRGHPAEDQGTALAKEVASLAWAHHTGERK